LSLACSNRPLKPKVILTDGRMHQARQLQGPLSRRQRGSMIVWRGRGGMIALIAFGCLVLAELFTKRVFSDPNYYQKHGWPKLAASWLAAALVYALRSWLCVGQERTLIDKDTGQEVKVPFEGSLLLIPARFWPAILFGLGLVCVLVQPL